MTRKTFWKLIYPELNWWINVRDYSTEIQDKQATVIENFNFEWNKLVTSKDCDSIYSSVTWGIINGMTVDWIWDVWYIQSGKIYKNWVEQENVWTSKVTITFTNQIEWTYYTFLSVDWIQLILTWNSMSSLVTQTQSALGWLYVVTNPSWNDIQISRTDLVVPVINNNTKRVYTISYSSINTIWSYKYLFISINWENHTFRWTDITSLISNINSNLNYVAYNNSWDITLRMSNWWDISANSSISMCKKIDLWTWNEHNKVDITIDWFSHTFDWQSYTSTDIYNYIAGNIWSNYYTYILDWIYIIKKNWDTPNILYNSYNRYTYSTGFKYADTPSSWQYHTSTTFWIDWTNYNFTVWDWLNTRIISNGRPFNGDLIVKYFEGKLTEVNTGFAFWSVFSPSKVWWTKLTIHKACKLTTVQVQQTDSVRLKNSSWTTIATASVSWWIATFNYDITPWVYTLEATTNDSYPNYYGSLSKTNEFFTAFSDGITTGNNIYFILWINIEWVILPTTTYSYTFQYNKNTGWADTVWNSWNRPYYFWENQTLRINKLDYSQMTITWTSAWTWWLPPSLYFTLNENTNPTTVSITIISNTSNISYITTQTYVISVTWTKYPYWDTVYDITVWNLWVLITDRRWIDAYYYDRNAHICRSLPTQVVGSPRIWTMWDWRTYLWWYADTDNIMWSQQANDIGSTVAVWNRYYTFWWGNGSWTQSISNWNKWKIVWFLAKDDWLYIFKEDWVYKANRIQTLKTDSNQDWTYESTEIESWHQFSEISSNWTLSQSTITEVNKDVFFYDPVSKAIRRLSYEWSSKLEDNAISDEIAPILRALPDQQFLANASYKYPLYKINLADSSAPLVRIWNWSTWEPWVNSPWQFYIPNITLVYNVETKCWTKEVNKNVTTKRPIFSYKWYFAWETWIIFNDDVWYTDNWKYYSKWYSFWNTKDYKKFWLAHIFWKIIPTSWYTKSLQMQVYVDWTKVDDRTVSSDIEKEIEIRIDLYDIWRYIEVRLFHSWEWKVEVYDLWFEVKQTTSYTSEYY